MKPLEADHSQFSSRLPGRCDSRLNMTLGDEKYAKFLWELPLCSLPKGNSTDTSIVRLSFFSMGLTFRVQVSGGDVVRSFFPITT